MGGAFVLLNCELDVRTNAKQYAVLAASLSLATGAVKVYAGKGCLAGPERLTSVLSSCRRGEAQPPRSLDNTHFVENL